MYTLHRNDRVKLEISNSKTFVLFNVEQVHGAISVSRAFYLGACATRR